MLAQNFPPDPSQPETDADAPPMVPRVSHPIKTQSEGNSARSTVEAAGGPPQSASSSWAHSGLRFIPQPPLL